MGKERKDIKSIFSEALEKKTAKERAAYLDKACGGDKKLRTDVEALLKAHDAAGSFLNGPPGGIGGTLDASPLTEGPGTRIGRYKLLQLIGEGGFGVVYMAEQEEPILRKVALKIIKLGMDTKQVIARFEAERQALAMMDHPNIARVFDAGATDTGRPYFVMELVKGIPITEYCDKNNLDTRQRLDLFIDVCKAVQHAHQKGIIHRDIKPSNVMITLHDGKPVPKIIDFGIAKATQHRLTEKTLFTEYRQLIGTPEYMSPEQAEMSGLDVDTRSDIYSLGVLLYELLTGTTPFEAEKLRSAAYDEIVRIIREDEPPKPSTRLNTLGEALSDVAKHRQVQPGELCKIVRGDLDWVVMRALEKDRTRRYETANEFAQDIGRHLGDEPVVAGPPSTVYHLRKFLRRRRALVASIAAVLVVLVAGAVVSTIFAIGQFRARAEAMLYVQTTEAAGGYIRSGLVAPETPIREVLDTASKELKGSSKLLEEMFGPRVKAFMQAFMHGMLGNMYSGLGLYEEAEPHFERAYQFFRDERSEEHPGTLKSMNDLAWLYQQQKRYDEAEPLFVKALEAKRRVLGEEDPGTLYSMTNLASLYSDQSRYEEAEQLFVKALEGNRRVLGEEHLDTLWSMTNLASLYSDQSRYEEAKALLVKVVELNPDNAYTSFGLALLQLYTGDIEGYRKTCTGMLEHFAQTENRDNAHWVAWTCLLAPDAVADLAHAVRLAERGVESGDKTDHDFNRLGAILYRAGRFEEAIDKLEEVITIWEKQGRLPTQISPAYTWFFLAMAHHQLGQHEEAKKWLAKATERAEQEIADNPLLYRQLTLELFRAEAKLLLGVPGQ